MTDGSVWETGMTRGGGMGRRNGRERERKIPLTNLTLVRKEKREDKRIWMLINFFPVPYPFKSRVLSS